MNTLKNEVMKIMNGKDTKLALLLKNLDTHETLMDINSTQQLVSASTIKVPIMLCALNEVLQHHLSLSQMILVQQEEILEDTQVFEQGCDSCSLEELISWMIISSDNTATNILIETLGFDQINHYILYTLQLEHTLLKRKMLDYTAIQQGRNNYTSQQDQMKIVHALLHHEILNPELCEKALAILRNQRCQNQIMRYIPYPIDFAHKTGELDYLLHDCGLLTLNQHHFYLGISLIDCEHIEGDFALMGTLGKTIITHLQQSLEREDKQ